MNKIYENEEFLVINKPAGLLVHGAEHIDEPTLVDDLLRNYPALAKVGEDPDRPGIMHRLDKPVSGLLVIAKTPASFENLKRQFQERTIEKHYTALVYGRIDKDEDEITFQIKRSAQGNKMAALPLSDKGEAITDGRRAITEFSIMKRFINYSLIDVRIKTGRTHQIRVHMSAYGHPVVGDDLYGTKKTRIKNAKLNLGRIFLVATRLEFNDIAGERHNFTLPLPPDLQNFLDGLR